MGLAVDMSNGRLHVFEQHRPPFGPPLFACSTLQRCLPLCIDLSRHDRPQARDSLGFGYVSKNLARQPEDLADADRKLVEYEKKSGF